VLQLEVAPLTLSHITQLLADTVHRDDEAVAPLAQLVLDKTGGNPFFLHEFLRTIHRKGLVRLVHGTGFVWELEAIRRASTTENVAELLLDRIRLLPARAQFALQYSACLGAEFDFETLFQVMSVTEDSRADLADDVAVMNAGQIVDQGPAREILQRPDVLVVNQPTWGVDASAAAAIRQALLDLASKGAAVIVVSQDLDELMEISDRFAALNEGRLSAARPSQGLTVDEIGLMLGGAHGMEVAHVGS
jgi:ABC-type molybdate transport system ATPase subunit